MLQEDTKIIMFNKVHKNASDINEGEKVKTRFGDDVVISKESGKESGAKIIFSDGYKITVGNTQEFFMANKQWKTVKEISEGDLVMKPDLSSAKVIDITNVKSISGVKIATKNGNGYTLSNGITTR